MNTSPATRLDTRLKRGSQIAGGAVMLFGLLGFAGWIFDIAPLRNVLPGLPSMVPNTALAFVLAGLSVVLWRLDGTASSRHRLAQVCALIVFAIGGVTVSEYLLGWNSGFDQLLLKDAPALAATALPGRPAMLTGLNFALLGTAFFLQDAKGAGSRLVDVLIVTALEISLLAVIGYACNVPSFYGWRSLYPQTAMSLPTVVAFLALGTGMLCTRPDRGLMAILTSATHGGVVARRLLLAPVIIPLVIGWLQLLARRLGIYNGELAGWIFSFTNIFVFTAAIWWVATLLHEAEQVRQRAEADLHRLNTELEQRVTERTAQINATNRQLEQEITERRRVEQTLRENEASFRLMFASNPLPMWVYDLESLRVLEVNAVALAKYGYSREEFLAMCITDIRLSEDTSRLIEHLARPRPALQFAGAWRHRLKDGRIIDVEITSHTLEFAGRNAVLIVSQDITERERAKREILRLNAELEQRVRERTAQLESVNKELEAFSYSVSHDLRAPLRHIDGFADMLRRDSSSNLSESGRRYLGVVSESARQMGTLIDDLLVFSRMGRAEIRRSIVKMNEQVDEVMRELERDTQNRQVAWTVDDLPDVSADRALLKQVWVNLLSNAVKYTRGRTRAEIRIGCRKNGDAEWEFSVCDNGAGFDMRYAGKLFGVFQRLHQPEEFEGTGVGLANVQRIVVRHGGSVRAEGKVDAGATFYFTLPETIVAKP